VSLDLQFDAARLGFALKAARVQLGISFRDLAGTAGVSPSLIQRVESGQFDCTLATVFKLCGPLALQPGALIEYAMTIRMEPFMQAAGGERIMPEFAPLVQTPKAEACFKNYVAGSAVVASYLIRSCIPSILAGLFRFVEDEHQLLFETKAAEFSRNPMEIENRLDHLSTLALTPMLGLARLGLMERRAVESFLRWGEHDNALGTPWDPDPCHYDNGIELIYSRRPAVSRTELRGGKSPLVHTSPRTPGVPSEPVSYSVYTEESPIRPVAQNKVLTGDSPKGKYLAMKSRMEKLLGNLKKATTKPGSKAELARELGVAPARISEWLSGKKEPGGEYTLRLLEWIGQKE
jgi:transcriptional regulator with XRE-family HTH domain